MTGAPPILLPSQVNTAEKLSLYVDNRVFSGWEMASVDCSLETASGGFSLQISGWGTDTIAPETECRIAIGEDVVFTGVIEGLSDAWSAKAHTLGVKGRSKTCDLVDCSAIAPLTKVVTGPRPPLAGPTTISYRASSFSGMKLDQIAAVLAEPYGVDVVSDVTDLEVVPSFRVQPGETVFEAIERAAKKQFVLLTDNAAGDLVITRGGAGEDASGKSRPLVLGQNILSREVTYDWTGRFRNYRIHGQGSSEGDGHHRQTGTATDDGVRRNRTLLLVGGSQMPGIDAGNRAEWEKKARIGKSINYTCTLQGWRDPTGAVWRPNTMASIWDPFQRMQGVPLLVVSVVLAITKEGATTTSLVLRPLAAYERPEQTVVRKKRGARWHAPWLPPEELTATLGKKNGKVVFLPEQPWLNEVQKEDLK